MTTVQAPGGELADWIAQREASDESHFDYWDHGQYVVVTGPSPEHQEVSDLLQERLRPIARDRGLRSTSATNLGRYGVDTRTPDIVVAHPDTARTSVAFLTTAEFVVEVLSPGEDPDAKLEFFADWKIDEYLTVDYRTHIYRLRLNHTTTGARWVDATYSRVLQLDVDDLFVDFDWPN